MSARRWIKLIYVNRSSRELDLQSIPIIDRAYCSVPFKGNGADDEARTRYLNLGKVALYRMSYVRVPIDVSNSNRSFCFCQAPIKKFFRSLVVIKIFDFVDRVLYNR